MQILIYNLNRNSLKLTSNFSPLDLSASYFSSSAARTTLSVSNDRGSFLLFAIFFGPSSYE